MGPSLDITRGLNSDISTGTHPTADGLFGIVSILPIGYVQLIINSPEAVLSQYRPTIKTRANRPRRRKQLNLIDPYLALRLSSDHTFGSQCSTTHKETQEGY